MGLGDRLHLEWISSAEAQKFVQVVTDFTEKIKKLGPSPLSLFIEKTKTQAMKPSKNSITNGITHAVSPFQIKESGVCSV